VRRAAKRDICEAEIIAALEAVGAKVTRISQGGMPDLLCSYRSVWYLLEVKSDKGKLTEDQETFIEYHTHCKTHVVRTVEEALRAINAIR
jgi:Holliday junction resolvase